MILPDQYEYIMVLSTICSIIRSSDTVQCPSYGGYTKRRNPLTLGIILPDAYMKKVEPAIELALNHIHNNSQFLAKYCLNAEYKNTQCKTSLGMKALFDLLSGNKSSEESVKNSRRPVSLFGDICLAVNEPISMASKYWNILHVSFTETHAKFGVTESRELYPTFFRMVPADRDLNTARCHLIKRFYWSRVGSVKQSDDSSLALAHEQLTTRLETEYNVRVVHTASLSSDQPQHIRAELNELKKKDVHIIIGDFRPGFGRSILCEAYLEGLYGIKYQWILPGYHRTTWWHDFDHLTNCTQDQLAQVLEGHFSIEFAPSRPFSREPALTSGRVRRIY